MGQDIPAAPTHEFLVESEAHLRSILDTVPDAIIVNIIERFGTLHKVLRATTGDLDEVEGVGSSRARAIKDGLSRLAETSILDRYS